MRNALVIITLGVFSWTDAVDFHITNKAGGPIWIGIQGNSGKPTLKNGGFALNQGQTETVGAPDDWAGRFWARTYCNPQSNHCLTGDCGNKLECAGAGGQPPATLIEITLKGSGGLDFYDVSLVDGFNVEGSIEPVGGQGDNGQYSCKKSKCGSDINSKCPPELQVKDGNTVIGCKSACAAFNTPEYCCTGSHNSEATCKSKDWPKDYPAQFKAECPDAYSYAFDDHKSTFTCKASQYNVVFGGV
ncbi:uncharacterized protein LOC132706992 [Cylas formicarius]|uniref:uncharacterized protein LOC132706992 n=1 Tax=Cylas formicarius TaxID=197179 RepID=UPI002958779E|nr:uncharacterized protein LOC132706992 [Cylas formicarius]